MAPPKAAIYCRLSEEDRNKGEAESESIQNQRTMLLQYAAEMGWAVTEIYCDEDYTGSDRSRPDFNRLLRDAECGKFEIILCKSQSRFTRELELVEKYLHGRFVELGIRFIGYADHADTANRGNKKARQINGLVNEWYLEDLSDNIRTVMRSKQRTGRFIGSFAPYGYCKSKADKNKLIPDEEVMEFVRYIFIKRLEGASPSAIAHELNEKGIENPSTYKSKKYPEFHRAGQIKTAWSAATVRSILENPVYCGNMRQHVREKISYKSDKVRNVPKEAQILVEDTHLPLVTKEQWQAAQITKGEHSKREKLGGRQNFCRCGVCGKRLYVKYSHGKKYFICKADRVLIQEEEVLQKAACYREARDMDALQMERDRMQEEICMAYADMAAGVLRREQFEAMNRKWQKRWAQLQCVQEENIAAKKQVLVAYPRSNRSEKTKLELLSEEEWQKRERQGMASTMLPR